MCDEYRTLGRSPKAEGYEGHYENKTAFHDLFEVKREADYY